MILVVGAADDRPLADVMAALQRRGAAFEFLDLGGAAAPRVVDVPTDAPGGTIALGCSTVDLRHVRSAYLRPVGEASPVEQLVCTWADCAPARIVNRPFAMAANNSKPYQAALIQRHGFATPATLITTNADAVRDFRTTHGTLVYKSISGVRSIVARLRDEATRPLDDVQHCPTQFQAYVPGTDHRVHVVGHRLFACRIDCDADDYRYVCGRVRPAISQATIPDDVAASILEMVHAMNLVVAGVDLRQHPDGTWYCFEVNPSPAFSYFASETGQPIAAAIASVLSDK